MAKIQDFRIGQKVRDIQTGWEMIVTTLGVLNLDMDSPYIYCDFEGNEGDVFEYEPDELEIVEEWKEIQGFPNNYISSCGRVKSNGVIRKLQLSNAGYLRVLLTNGSRKWNASVHRLVALAFIQNPKCLPMVNHKDENKQNNNATNLEWCTREYNMNYGTAKRRFIETHNKRGSKKAERPVSMIKQNGEIAGTYRSAREAERQTGIHESSIRQVLYGKRKQAGGYGWKYSN